MDRLEDDKLSTFSYTREEWLQGKERDFLERWDNQEWLITVKARGLMPVWNFDTTFLF